MIPADTPLLSSSSHCKAVFIFISHLTVPAGDQEALERHFRDRARLVDGMPGFLYLQLLRPEAGSASHTFLTAWEAREEFRQYMQSEEHRVSHSREPAEIMARTTVRHEAFDHLATALELGDADIFVRYTQWLLQLLCVRNVAVSDIARSFHLVATECEDRFPHAEAAITKRALTHGLEVMA